MISYGTWTMKFHSDWQVRERHLPPWTGAAGFSLAPTPRQFAFMPLFFMALFSLVLACAATAWAGEADVVDARAEQSANGTWRFDVTVAHADEGWDHYADRWDVVAPDGTVIGSRTLHHPHVEEQPFTRSLSGVVIPDGVDRVTIRAHDNVHGLGGAEMTIDLSEASGG